MAKRPTLQNIIRLARDAGIISAYWDGLTIEEIATEYGLSKGGVHAVLRKNKAHRPSTTEPILADLKDGQMSQNAIAEKHGVSKQYVSYVSKTYIWGK